MFLCDTWTGIVKTTDVDTYYHDGKHDDTSKATVESLVHRLGVAEHVQLLQGIFPEDTGHVAEGHQFRLIHIDVDVYQSCVDVFEWAWPRLSAGGAVVFDDYGCPATPGVTKFVDGLKRHAGPHPRAQPQRPRHPVQALRKAEVSASASGVPIS